MQHDGVGEADGDQQLGPAVPGEVAVLGGAQLAARARFEDPPFVLGDAGVLGDQGADIHGGDVLPGDGEVGDRLRRGLRAAAPGGLQRRR